VSHYAARTKRPPRTLTDDEIARYLRVTGEHRRGFRDHVIFSLALGTGLRESEIAALDVGDVCNDAGNPKRTIYLRVYKRMGAGADPDRQSVTLPDDTFYKLDKWLRVRKGSLGDPLFTSRSVGGRRISSRTIRHAFRLWQRRAGFDRPYHFHAIRHTAITAAGRKGGLRLAFRVSRHASIGSTMIYDHLSDQEVAALVKDIKA
jgi:integrase/recombinase XerC